MFLYVSVVCYFNSQDCFPQPFNILRVFLILNSVTALDSCCYETLLVTKVLILLLLGTKRSTGSCDAPVCNTHYSVFCLYVFMSILSYFTTSQNVYNSLMNASLLVLTVNLLGFSGIRCHKITFGKSKIRPLKNTEDTYTFKIKTNLGSVVSIFNLLSRKQGHLLIGYVLNS